MIKYFQQSESGRLIRRILDYFRKYTFRIVLSFVALSIVAACTAGAAYLVQPALDEIFINKDKVALARIPLLLVGLFALKGTFMFLQKYLMSYCGLKVLEELRNDLYAKIIHLPVGYFGEAKTGMLMSRVLSDVDLIRSSLPEFIRIIRQALTMVALVALIIYRDSFLAFWALLVFPLAVYPVVHFGKKLRKLGRKQQSQIADISSILQETFSGIRVMKAFAAEEQESAAFRKSNGKLIRLALKGTVYNLLSSPIMEFIGALGAGLVIWYGGSQVIAGNATPGSFFSFMTALIMLYEPFKSISSANNQIQKALAGAERVFDILDSPKIREEQGGQRPFGNEFQALDINKVSFTYPDAATPALNNINLHIRAGEKIAIVGSSGSGKTTLANLIPRFFDVKDGDVRLNNIPLRDYRLEELRRSIGIVSQDPFLFNTSVIENIRYGNEQISKDLVEQAARAAYANDFIAELPEKYDTVIGERGVKLSGGQKQRITIARAILKNPSLLILDEATSALDTESERIVQQALENLMQDRTSIVIAHRLSTILSADRIVVMNKGEIVDIGSHDQLLESCSVYRKLYTMQFSEAELNEA